MRIAPDHEAVALSRMSAFWSGVFREQQSGNRIGGRVPPRYFSAFTCREKGKVGTLGVQADAGKNSR